MSELKKLLMKLVAWIKAHWVSALTILVGLAITYWAVGRACKVGDDYSRLKGEYNILKKNADEQAKIATQNEKKFKTDIQAADKEIASLRANVAQKQAQNSKLSGDLAKLEGLYPTLTDCATRLANMSNQVDIWKQKFSLAEKTIADKDAEIKLWGIKFDEAVALGESWKQSYLKEKTAREACQKSLSSLERKVGGLQFGGTVKTIFIGAAAGYIIYNSVRK